MWNALERNQHMEKAPPEGGAKNQVVCYVRHTRGLRDVPGLKLLEGHYVGVGGRAVRIGWQWRLHRDGSCGKYRHAHTEKKKKDKDYEADAGTHSHVPLVLVVVTHRYTSFPSLRHFCSALTEQLPKYPSAGESL